MTAIQTNAKSTGARFLACLVLFAILASSQMIYAHAAAPRFSDVGPNHWAYTYVEQAAQMGFVSGVTETTFGPDATVTNAQFLTMVTRAFYAKSASAAVEFSDGGEWWLPYAETAYIKGILRATTVLGPRDSEEAQWDNTINQGITRYDMAQIIYNVMLLETTKTPADSEILEARRHIADWSSVPTNYMQAVSACYATGCLSGIDDAGTFGGTSYMTRAQAATVMCKLMA